MNFTNTIYHFILSPNVYISQKNSMIPETKCCNMHITCVHILNCKKTLKSYFIDNMVWNQLQKLCKKTSYKACKLFRLSIEEKFELFTE